MDNLRDKFRRFMVGRYGMDELNRFLAALTLIFVIVHLFVRSPVFFWLELASIILVYMRMFSRNTGKRFHENHLPAWLKNAGFYLHSHLNVMHSVCSHWQALEPPT